MSLAWTYKAWAGVFPSMGSDELYRHTLVIPNPFVISEVDEKDGTKYHPALVLVVAPWWLCRHILDADYRETARRERRIAKVDRRELHAELEGFSSDI